MISSFLRLSAAGFAATAISYGPARMGFGLFVPVFKSTFALSTSAVGLISSIGFFGCLIGLLVAQALLNRHGPQVPVLAGLVAATLGLGIVALAQGAMHLALGVFLAASSAGFAWTPFNDAVHRTIRDTDRSTALSEISTGTSIGVALAGAISLGMVLSGFSWRICWGLFAVSSLAALVANRKGLRHLGKSRDDGPNDMWRTLLRSAAVPLFGVAFVFGLTSAVFISFAADRFAENGAMAGLPNGAVPSLVFIFFGLFGLSGLATAQARRTLGLPWLLRLLMVIGAASLVLAAVRPAGWAGPILSAGLQGMHVMMTSAVLAFWSERLFPALPSLGFTAALLAMAAGSVAGPALAGIFAANAGPAAMFLTMAVLPGLAACILLARFVTDAPADSRGSSPAWLRARPARRSGSGFLHRPQGRQERERQGCVGVRRKRER